MATRNIDWNSPVRLPRHGLADDLLRVSCILLLITTIGLGLAQTVGKIYEPGSAERSASLRW